MIFSYNVIELKLLASIFKPLLAPAG